MNYEDRVTKEYIETALAGKCEVVFGTYVGDGAASRVIELGFTPRAVFVCRKDGQTHTESYGPTSYSGGLVLPGNPVTTNYSTYASTVLEIVTGGFRVVHDTYISNFQRYLGESNQNGMTFYYLAVR